MAQQQQPQSEQVRQRLPLPSISTLRRRGNSFGEDATSEAAGYSPPYCSPAASNSSEDGSCYPASSASPPKWPRYGHPHTHHRMMTPIVPHEELVTMLDNYLDGGTSSSSSSRQQAHAYCIQLLNGAVSKRARHN